MGGGEEITPPPTFPLIATLYPLASGQDMCVCVGCFSLTLPLLCLLPLIDYIFLPYICL